MGVAVTAWLALLAARDGAPEIYRALTGSVWAFLFHIVVGVSAVGALAALWFRRWRTARALAAAQATVMLWGWGEAQFPFIVVPDLTFHGTATDPDVLKVILIALVAGSIVLVPSFLLLFRLFTPTGDDAARQEEE